MVAMYNWSMPVQKARKDRIRPIKQGEYGKVLKIAQPGQKTTL